MLRRIVSLGTLVLTQGCSAPHGAYERGKDVAGYHVVFTADPLVVGEPNDVSVSLTRNGAPVADAQVSIGLTMPQMQMQESHRALAPRGDGRYDGRCRLAMSGRWRARVTAHAGRGPVIAASFDFEARDR